MAEIEAPHGVVNACQKLQSLKKTYELVIYAGDNHVLSRNREDRDRRVVAWFRKHMKPQS